jgi:SAM-dependent methyltransferase
MTGDRLRTVLTQLALQYPPNLRQAQLNDVARIAFHIELVRAASPGPEAAPRICDIGGGVGLFSLGCAAMGMSAMLVDDFVEDIAGCPADEILALHRQHGVEIRQQDVLAGLDVPPGSLSAVTSFHSIEHWHHSPKRLFADVMRALHPGGLFVLAAPNAVNLRKRVGVVFGRSNWSTLSEWYDSDIFRAHVRVPTVSDLRAMATQMGLTDIVTFGRNWLGLSNSRPLVRVTARCADRVLRLRPTLCSDIYVIGTKPGHGLA